MRKEHQLALRKEVERIYGKKIVAYADCLQLTKEIAQKTGFRINVNTARRFFGVVQATYPPSLTTLEIISQYAGFRSFEHFVESHQPLAGSKTEVPAPYFLDYVSILFEKAAATTAGDPTWYNIVRETIFYLERHPQLVAPFQRMAVRTTIGLDIYFEQFVHIDGLNGSYGDGLRYYLNAKDTPDARLFGHALLALRSFLTEDGEGLETHYRKVISHPPDRSTHPFLCARFFATQLFYHQKDPGKLYSIALEARRFYADLPPSRDAYQTFPCFELVFSEALVLTGQAAEALFYIQESRRKRTDYVPPTVDTRLFAALDLYEAVAFARLGEMERAKKALKKIRSNEFYFLSRRFLTILYSTVETVVGRCTESLEDIYREKLLGETGFSVLRFSFLPEESVNKKEQ